MPEPLTILVVDDEPEMARILADMLLPDGHTVDIALSGSAALDLVLTARSYDIIVADLLMPGLDGAALYREIGRSVPHLLRRFIFSTADGLAGDTLRRVGVAVITKPFSHAEVSAVVQFVANL